MNSTILRLILTAIVCVVIGVTVDWADVTEALGSVDPVLIAVTFVVAYTAYLVGALKWRALLRARGIEERVGRLFRLNLLSMFYSFALPGQVAGESIKALRIARGDAQAAALVASIFVDRLTGLVGVLIVGAVGLVVAPPADVPALRVLVVGAVFLLVVTVVVLSLSKLPQRFGRIGRAVRGVSSATAGYRDHPGALVVALAYSIVFQLFVVATLWIPAHALGLGLGGWDIAWVAATVSFAQMVPLTIAGLGPREGTLVVVLAPLGISSHDALAFSLLIFATNASMAIGGAIGELLPNSDRRDVDPERT